ncbi:hypothetical protein Btru_055699 [Bulinus truncatus]|nr:hypothetical protein Btru_055699 [Bulinus truncatus]
MTYCGIYKRKQNRNLRNENGTTNISYNDDSRTNDAILDKIVSDEHLTEKSTAALQVSPDSRNDNCSQPFPKHLRLHPPNSYENIGDPKVPEMHEVINIFPVQQPEEGSIAPSSNQPQEEENFAPSHRQPHEEGNPATLRVGGMPSNDDESSDFQNVYARLGGVNRDVQNDYDDMRTIRMTILSKRLNDEKTDRSDDEDVLHEYRTSSSEM